MKHIALVLAAVIAGCHREGADTRGIAPPASAVLSASTMPPSSASAPVAPAAWKPLLPFRDLATSLGQTCVVDRLGDIGCTKQGGGRWRPRPAGAPIDHLALAQLELCALSSGELSCVTVEGDALVPKLNGVAEVGISDEAGCARGVDGAVRCWKQGGAPGAIAGVEGATAVAVGHPMACAIVGGGSVRCWSPASSRAEMLAGVERADEVGCGKGFCCARSQGKVQCWGGNHRGQLGRATAGGLDRPGVVDGVIGARSLAVGWTHTCVALADGGVVCWGSGEELGSFGERCPASPGTCASLTTCQRSCRTPVRIEGVSDATRVVAGYGTCALRGGAPPLCWGGSVTSYGADASTRAPAAFTW